MLIVKFLSFSNNNLYVASHNTIKVVHLGDLKHSKADPNLPIIPLEEDILTINLENEHENKDVPCKLLGILSHRFLDREGNQMPHASIITCIESKQSIVDYSFLNVKPTQSLNAN